MATPERRQAERGGRRAEALAVWWLRLHACAILATRFKTPVGELDIVARRGRQLIFVEVKARARADGEAAALEAVNRQRIAAAARWYLARHPHLAGLDIRFDVIFLAPRALPRHVTNAFTA